MKNQFENTKTAQKNQELSGDATLLDKGINLPDLFKESPSFIAVLSGPQHTFILANPSYKELVGKDRELIGKSVQEALPETAEQGFIELLDRVYQTGETYIGNETPVKLARDENNPETVFVNFNYQLITLSDGGKGIFVHGIDVTDQVKARQEIALRKERYSSLFEKMDQGFCIIEVLFDQDQKPVDYVFEEVNKTFERQTGLANAIGKTARQLVPNLEPHWFELYGKVALTGEPVQFIEGSEAMGRWFDVYAYRIGNNDSRKVALLFTDITERKKQEIELHKTRTQLSMTVEHSPSSMTLFDKNGEIITANNMAAHYYGYDSVEELLAEKDRKSIRKRFYQQFELFEEDGRPLDKRLLPDELVRKGALEAQRVIQFYDKKSKEQVFLLLKAKAINNELGELQYIIQSSTDITIQKDHQKMEATLQDTELRFQTMADNISQLAWMTDDKGYIFWYNKRWFEYTGTTQEEMRRWGWSKVHHPDHVDRVVLKISECFSKGTDWEDTFPLRGKDGSYRWFLSRATAIRNEKGEITNWFGTNTDITDQRQARERLSYQKGLLEAQQKASPMGILVTDPDRKIITHNQRFKDIWQLSEEPLIGKDEREIRKLITPLIQDRINSEADLEVFYTTRSLGHDKYQLKDGRIIEWFGAPIKGKKDEYFGYAIFYLDVSEREMLIRQKDIFLGIASHELKTPVTSILAYTQMLQLQFEDSEDQRTYQMLCKMHQQIHRLTDLINDLLDVTKIEQGKLKLREEAFDFNKMVEDVAEEIQRTSSTHQIKIKTNSNRKIHGDRDRLGQVLTNFLTNAIKYSPQENEVKVTVTYDEEKLHLAVKDDGLGIDKEDKKRVFERFYRVDEKAQESFPGLGLGLFISSEIIQRHGGQIGVQSTKGKGSTFYFTLPLNKKATTG